MQKCGIVLVREIMTMVTIMMAHAVKDPENPNEKKLEVDFSDLRDI